jgi:hypothetical protein
VEIEKAPLTNGKDINKILRKLRANPVVVVKAFENLLCSTVFQRG